VLNAGMESKSIGWLAAGKPFLSSRTNKCANFELNLSIQTAAAVSGFNGGFPAKFKGIVDQVLQYAVDQ